MTPRRARTPSASLRNRRKKMRDRQWRIYQKLLDKCEKAIDSLLAERRHRLSALDISRLLDAAERLGRLAAGLPKDALPEDIDSDREDAVTAKFLAEIKRVYGNPSDTESNNANQSMIANPPPSVGTSWSRAGPT